MREAIAFPMDVKKHFCFLEEGYTLYAVLRRLGDGIEVEIVGEMLRPWLDGIKPDWVRLF